MADVSIDAASRSQPLEAERQVPARVLRTGLLNGEEPAIERDEERRHTETGLYWVNFYSAAPFIRWFFW